METVATVSLILSAVTAALFAMNLLLFRRLPRAVRTDSLLKNSGNSLPTRAALKRVPVSAAACRASTVGERTHGPHSVSVLIPARNEEHSIGRAIDSVLANRDIPLEVIVLDDHSEDRTAAVVRELARRDPRVRLVSGPPLPSGWCGKQHACYVLSECAGFDLLCFLDADVRLMPDALSRMAAFLDRTDADLISGFPQQETVTFLERLLIPLIHFVLLGYLPMAGLRLTRLPAFAAGCGQLMLARRSAYRAAGGHSAIKASLHDGIRLPQAFRSAGLTTDIFDATDLAVCRMYRSASEVWHGLAKNAVEGMAAPARIPVFTALLVGGQVLPFLLLGLQARYAMAAVALALIPRLVCAVRFRQPIGSALLHPAGIALLVAIQWYALGRRLLRRPSSWKGRAYGAGVTGLSRL